MAIDREREKKTEIRRKRRKAVNVKILRYLANFKSQASVLFKAVFHLLSIINS